LPEYLFQGLARQVDLGRLDGRARLAELARPYLSKVTHGVLRELMLERLAELTRTGRDSLAPMLKTEAKAATHPSTTSGREARQAPSIMRMAIGLLVQNPGLATKAPRAEMFADLDEPGAELFTGMLEWLQENPGLNTAAVVEHYRDSPEAQHVARLAVWEHPMLEQNVEAEFSGLVTKLTRKSVQAQTDTLLRKEKLGGLTDAEKAELARLLRLKASFTGNISEKH
jgi:DNA primase